jgi:hypothetical protein
MDEEGEYEDVSGEDGASQDDDPVGVDQIQIDDQDSKRQFKHE